MITTSSETDQLFPALFEVQSRIGHLEKSKLNKHIGNWYADLPTVLATIKPILKEFRLVLNQGASPLGDSGMLVSSRITHADSGQWVETSVPLPFEMRVVKKGEPMQATPQSAGSAITYGRRYSLTALLGITQADDDGNVSSGLVQSDQDVVSEDDPLVVAVAAAKTIQEVHDAVSKYRGETKLSVSNARSVCKARADSIRNRWISRLETIEDIADVAMFSGAEVDSTRDPHFSAKAKQNRITWLQKTGKDELV